MLFGVGDTLPGELMTLLPGTGDAA